MLQGAKIFMNSDESCLSEKDGASDKTILSVDDDAVNQAVIEFLLQGNGYSVTTAMDGIEALDYLGSSNRLPDLILLDVMMPNMSGYEVCSRIRQLYPPWIPVIMISAKCTKEDIVRGLSCGCNDYVTKPFDKEELLSRIDCHVRLNVLRNHQLYTLEARQILRRALPRGMDTVDPRAEYLLITITIEPHATIEEYRSYLSQLCEKARLTVIPTRLAIFHACGPFHDGVYKFATELVQKIETQDGHAVRIYLTKGSGIQSYAFIPQSVKTSRQIVPSLFLFGKIVEEHVILMTKPALSGGPGYMKSVIICHSSMTQYFAKRADISIESKFNYSRIFLKDNEILKSSHPASTPLPNPPELYMLKNAGCETVPKGFRNQVVTDLENVISSNLPPRESRINFVTQATDLIKSYNPDNAAAVFKSLEQLLSNLRDAIAEQREEPLDQLYESIPREKLDHVFQLYDKIQTYAIYLTSMPMFNSLMNERNKLEAIYKKTVKVVNQNLNTVLNIENLNEMMYLEIQRRELEFPFSEGMRNSRSESSTSAPCRQDEVPQPDSENFT
jgi:CheY-like chemotaxis protein